MPSLEDLRRALMRRLVRRGALPQDAEDTIQEAFVRLCIAQRKEHVRNPAAFLTDVVTKVHIEHWRSAQRHHRLFVDEPAEDLDFADRSPQPEEYVQAEQRLERIWRRLEELNPRSREVLFLHRLGGLNCREIAVVLHVSVSAIEKHIARAVRALEHERRAE